MESRMKRMIRILFLTMLVLFAAQFAGARPAANHSKSDGRELAQAAEAPQKPQRQPAAAKPQAQVVQDEAGNDDQTPPDVGLQREMDDVRRQFENEALNRICKHALRQLVDHCPMVAGPPTEMRVMGLEIVVVSCEMLG